MTTKEDLFRDKVIEVVNCYYPDEVLNSGAYQLILEAIDELSAKIQDAPEDFKEIEKARRLHEEKYGDLQRAISNGIVKF